MTMNRRHFAGAMAAGLLLSGGCAFDNRLNGKPQTDRELKGMGYIVTIDHVKPRPVPPAGMKDVYIDGITDAGNPIISSNFGGGAGLSSFGGGGNMSFPRWVNVYYRKLANQQDLGKKIDPLTGKKISMLAQGDIFAEYHVEVLSRIPEEVFKFAQAKRRRAIRLKFRIKEDGVLFGWDVQEMNLERKTIKFAMMGGDFLDDWGGLPFKPQDLIDTTKE